MRGVVKRFGETLALDGVDLTVPTGSVYGLLGPNGSGKSTTIKMLLGLLQPTAGRIAVLGKRPKDVAVKKLIGYLPEESYLYRYLNSEETVDFFGSLFHIESKERRDRAEQLIEMVGLENARSRHVGEFSKGMQRRIGLAQALINDPDLIILDWNLPDFSGIDICQRIRAGGITIPILMLTGHDEITDRVKALDAGVDDYLVKPFSIEELLARLRALQRRSNALQPQASEPDVLRIGDLELNQANHDVRRGSRSIQAAPIAGIDG